LKVASDMRKAGACASSLSCRLLRYLGFMSSGGEQGGGGNSVSAGFAACMARRDAGPVCCRQGWRRAAGAHILPPQSCAAPRPAGCPAWQAAGPAAAALSLREGTPGAGPGVEHQHVSRPDGAAARRPAHACSPAPAAPV
jgi:hypothetical protein